MLPVSCPPRLLLGLVRRRLTLRPGGLLLTWSIPSVEYEGTGWCEGVREGVRERVGRRGDVREDVMVGVKY